MTGSGMKRILITGANKGIGLATVKKVLESDDRAHVLLGARHRGRGEAAIASLVEETPSFRERLELLEIDVAQDDSVAQAKATVASKFGTDPAPLYAVVNNAGIGLSGVPMADVLEVNVHGMRRVCDAFIPLLDPTLGRVVNVTSGSGPMFVAQCAPETQRLLTDPTITWEQIVTLLDGCLAAEAQGDFSPLGVGSGAPYGLSKACANAYNLYLARQHPNLQINACTPGFIATDLTVPYAEASGKSPAEMGMKSPEEGTLSVLFLLFGELLETGRYYGSDAIRSPLDRYRSPGDPPYTGA